MKSERDSVADRKRSPEQLAEDTQLFVEASRRGLESSLNAEFLVEVLIELLVEKSVFNPAEVINRYAHLSDSLLASAAAHPGVESVERLLRRLRAKYLSGSASS